MKTKHRRQAAAKRIQRDYCAHQRVIGKVQTLTPAEQAECALPVRLAWEALRNGTANGNDYRSLSDDGGGGCGRFLGGGGGGG